MSLNLMRGSEVLALQPAPPVLDRAAKRVLWNASAAQSLARLASPLAEFTKYTAVAAVALVVDVTTLYACTAVLQLHYLVSAALGFATGLLTNYLLCVNLVFSRRRMSSAALEFQLFAAIGVVGLLLNELCMWVIVEWFGIHYVASKLVSAAIVFMWNFAARKVTLFK